MKKLLLLSLVAAVGCFGTKAQELSFLYEGEPVPDKGTVIYEEIEEEAYPEMSYWVATIDPKLHIVSEADATVTVHTKSNVPIQLCAGGACEFGDELTKSQVNLTSDVPLNLQLDWVADSFEGPVTDIPYIEVFIEAWYNDDPSNYISMTLKMGTGAEVKSINTNRNKVSVAGKMLNYSLDKASSITIYSLTGRTVKSINASGNGSVNLDTLPAGVYIYRLSNSKTTGKFVIL